MRIAARSESVQVRLQEARNHAVSTWQTWNDVCIRRWPEARLYNGGEKERMAIFGQTLCAPGTCAGCDSSRHWLRTEFQSVSGYHPADDVTLSERDVEALRDLVENDALGKGVSFRMHGNEVRRRNRAYGELEGDIEEAEEVMEPQTTPAQNFRDELARWSYWFNRDMAETVAKIGLIVTVGIMLLGISIGVLAFGLSFMADFLLDLHIGK